ncbi:hypothetical protein ABTC79_19680, partial [Acinetobacter baumannii]
RQVLLFGNIHMIETLYGGKEREKEECFLSIDVGQKISEYECHTVQHMQPNHNQKQEAMRR